jgi:hypothetical protein
MQLGRRGMTVGGDVRWWWSAARGVGLSYSVARCSGCGRGGQRGAGAAVHDSGYGGGQSGEVAKEEEKGAPRWGVAPL